MLRDSNDVCTSTERAQVPFLAASTARGVGGVGLHANMLGVRRRRIFRPRASAAAAKRAGTLLLRKTKTETSQGLSGALLSAPWATRGAADACGRHSDDARARCDGEATGEVHASREGGADRSPSSLVYI